MKPIRDLTIRPDLQRRDVGHRPQLKYVNVCDRGSPIESIF
jgi:hypothetical protein